MKYTAHGLVFESEISLTPLPPIECDTVDVVISYSPVSKKGLEDPLRKRPFSHAKEDVLWLDIPNVARYQIADGNRILVDPYPGADEKSVRLFIFGSSMGAILHQRGYLVLHANAVNVGKGLVLFAGASGVGKSTTAAIFNQRGFDVVSDDVVAVSPGCHVIGGFPQIKLWADTLSHLDIEATRLSKLRDQIQKYGLPIEPVDDRAEMPIMAIYLLQTANELQSDKFEFAPLKGIEKFHGLKQCTYRRGFMEGMGLKPLHMKLCSTLATRTPMSIITRPTSRFNGPELVDAALSNLQSLGLLDAEYSYTSKT